MPCRSPCASTHHPEPTIADHPHSAFPPMRSTSPRHTGTTTAALWTLLCMLWLLSPGQAAAQATISPHAPVDTLEALLHGTLEVEVGTDGPNYSRPAQAWLARHGKLSPEDSTSSRPVAPQRDVPSGPAHAAAQSPPRRLADSVAVFPLPDAATTPLETLNVKNADLRDVFRGIAHQYGLNLVVDNAIGKRITVRLSGLPVLEALEFLCERNGLRLRRSRHIFYVELPPEPTPPPPKPPRVFVRDSLLTLDLNGDELGAVMHLVAQQSGTNILVRRGVQGPLTGTLRDVPVEQGLRTLLHNNGFSLRRRDDILHVDRAGIQTDTDGETSGAFWVQVEDSIVTLDVTNARVADVVREIGAQMKVDLITYDAPEERITAKAARLTLEEALTLLLRQTSVTFRREDGVYFIGNKQTQVRAALQAYRQRQTDEVLRHPDPRGP